MIGHALLSLAVVAIFAGAAPVSAKNGIYIGGSIGQTTLKINEFNLDLEDFDYKADTTSYKIIVGYRFFAYLAVEGSYVDFGTLEDSSDAGGEPVSVETDLKGYDAFAVGLLPLGIVDVFGKIGVVSWDADFSAAIGEITDFDSGSGTDLVYGAGVQVRFKGLGVRGEVEYFDIADADSVYLISVGATFTF
jgi:hypothetical protein